MDVISGFRLTRAIYCAYLSHERGVTLLPKCLLSFINNDDNHHSGARLIKAMNLISGATSMQAVGERWGWDEAGKYERQLIRATQSQRCLVLLASMWNRIVWPLSSWWSQRRMMGVCLAGVRRHEFNGLIRAWYLLMDECRQCWPYKEGHIIG